MPSDNPGYVDRVEAFAAAWPRTTDMIISLRPVAPAEPSIALLRSDVIRLAAERRTLTEQLAARARATASAQVWLYEKDGAEPEPWASLDAAQADACAGWPTGSFLAWRHAPDGSMRLYVDDAWTHRVITPATVRTGPASAGDADKPTVGVVRSCRTCGCTQDDACEGGCAWVTDGTLEIDLCTACAWAIARDAIASGLYHLEPTAGDTLFEARGGLIPQPALTEAEIEGLQPLIEAVEAAQGDPEKLDAIAALPTHAEFALLTLIAQASVPVAVSDFFDAINPRPLGLDENHPAHPAWCERQVALYQASVDLWQKQLIRVVSPADGETHRDLVEATSAARASLAASTALLRRPRYALANDGSSIEIDGEPQYFMQLPPVETNALVVPSMWTAPDGTEYDLSAAFVDRFEHRWECNGWLTQAGGRADSSIPQLIADFGDHMEFLPIHDVLASYGPLTAVAESAPGGVGPDAQAQP